MRTPSRLLLLWLLIVPAAWPQGTNLPEGKGKAQFTRICGECHAVEIVVRKTNTEDGWAAIVDDMVSRGAQGTDDDFSLVVKYLAAHFAPKVKINTADANELSTILGVSPEDAAALVKCRESAGHFKEWRDLEKVPHIDIKKLEQQRDRIDFSTAPAESGQKK